MEIKLEDIIVIDNALPTLFYQHLKSKVFSSQVHWIFTEGTSDSNDQTLVNDPCSWSLAHLAINDTRYLSPLSETCANTLVLILDNIEQEVSVLHRARLGLLPNFGKSVIHGAHVDQNFEHYTALLYFNNNDGNTLFYDHTYDGYSNKTTVEYYQDHKQDFKVIKEVEPKENRCVIFNGLIYHSSSSPTKDKRRITLNFNFDIKSK